MSSSESTGCEPFELSEINDNDQNQDKNNDDAAFFPNCDNEKETFFVTGHQKPPSQPQVVRNSPRVYKNVPQLNSENRDNELKRIADQQRPSTWAQAVQKTPVNDKNDFPNAEGTVKPEDSCQPSPKWILPANTTDLFAKKKRRSKSKKIGKEV
jgi:hypothetical protein